MKIYTADKYVIPPREIFHTAKDILYRENMFVPPRKYIHSVANITFCTASYFLFCREKKPFTLRNKFDTAANSGATAANARAREVSSVCLAQAANSGACDDWPSQAPTLLFGSWRRSDQSGRDRRYQIRIASRSRPDRTGPAL